ncbi:MAG TPA: FUSC family protein [Acidimicrobiales bacterium]
MATRFERVMHLADRLIASDPGLVQLRSASTKVLSLGAALAVLYGFTKVWGQPFTVALLGLLISLTSLGYGGGRPVHQLATAALMLVVTGISVTLGVWLTSDKVARDLVLVAIIGASIFAQRFGLVATNLGVASFTTYLLTVFLGATTTPLPWLLAAVATGTAANLGIGILLREHPSRLINRIGQSLDSRLALVVAGVADGLAAPMWTSRAQRRLARRVGQVHDTMLMIGSELDDVTQQDLPRSGERDTIARRLFDVELSVDYLSSAWERTAEGERGPDQGADSNPETRSSVRDALLAVGVGLRAPQPDGALAEAQTIAASVAANPTTPPHWQSLARSVSALSCAIENLRAAEVGSASEQPARDYPPPAIDEERSDTSAQHDTQRNNNSGPQGEDRSANGSLDAQLVTAPRLSPNTRKVVQVTVAAVLAIVVGHVLSPSRWYWALIAAFVVYQGTSTRAQALTKGWQRVVGSVIGVGVGTVIASLVGGNVAASLALIFVALFIGFYLWRVSYAVAITCVTTMLALLFGLVGDFSIDLLLSRVEETAVGAAIGIAAAFLILPIRTTTAVRDGIRSFLQHLADLVAMTGRQLTGQGHYDLLRAVRELDLQLVAVRTNVEPLTKGILGLRYRSGARWVLRVLDICDHAARGLARVAIPVGDQAAAQALEDAALRTFDNIGLVIEAIERRAPASLVPSDDLTADIERTIARLPVQPAERRRLELAERHLNQIQFAMLQLAHATAGDEVTL